MKKFGFAIIIILCLNYTLYGQQESSGIDLNTIMRGEEFVGYLPENISWSEDSKTIYFSWNPEFEVLRDLYKVSRTGGKPERVGVEERKALPGRGVYSHDRKCKLFSKNGDVFVLYLQENRTVQVTNTTDNEYQPVFSGDDKHVVYRRGLNLFSWDIKSGTTRQLTNFVSGSENKAVKKADYEEWIEQDELSLMTVLRDRDDRQLLDEKRSDLLKPSYPDKFYLNGRSLSSVRISPDMKVITFKLSKYPKVKRTLVPHYVSKSGFVDQQKSRSLVGAPSAQYEFGVYLTDSDSSYLLDPKQIPGIYDKPDYLKEYVKKGDTLATEYKKARKVYVFGPWFSDDSKVLLNIKALDNKDRWLMLLDPGSGELKLLDRQHDNAWVGGPGIFGWQVSPGLGWLEDGKIWFQSEETGYSHIYTIDVNNMEKRALTKGKFEILKANLSIDKKTFYITSNKETPFEQHFYRMSSEGGAMEKISRRPGKCEVTISPDEKYLAVRYSYSNKPWELYVMRNKPGADMTPLTHSTTEAFDAINWYDPEIIHFRAGDGVDVPARLYLPDKDKKNGAAILFVHGAGYLQNVHRWWSSYYREYMFHNMLIERGYTVLDIDYRGSSGYGRDWRTAIYRHMGGRDLEDYVDGADFLVKHYQIDPERMAIYGGSYGGFITLMAMFNRPGVFVSGAALRSVTDWAHYNHGYTSNILNTPVEDSLSYRRSSPIYFADGLEGKLLMLHGMIDDNVQFQDIVRLSQRLIELGKDNWELAVFPVERHGFKESSSWQQEYSRIFKLFEETLRK